MGLFFSRFFKGDPSLFIGKIGVVGVEIGKEGCFIIKGLSVGVNLGSSGRTRFGKYSWLSKEFSACLFVGNVTGDARGVSMFSNCCSGCKSNWEFSETIG